MQQPELITRFDQLESNALTYMDTIKNRASLSPELRKTMMKTLTLTRWWFCIKQEDGTLLVVPAKFGGYARNNPVFYDEFRQTIMHGGKAEAAIKAVGTLKKGGSLNPLMKLIPGGFIPHPHSVVYTIEPNEVTNTLSQNDRKRIAALMAMIDLTEFDDRDSALDELVGQYA